MSGKSDDQAIPPGHLETVQLSPEAIEALHRVAHGSPDKFKELVAAKHPEGAKASAPTGDTQAVTLNLSQRVVEALDHLAKLSGKSRDELVATLITQALVSAR